MAKEKFDRFAPNSIHVLFRAKNTFYALAFFQLLSHSAQAQESYPPLTHVISFLDLEQRKTSKMVEWTNPNGVHEKMRILQMEIPIDQGMRELTMQFVRRNYGLNSIWVAPRVIVFHAMGDGNLKTSLEVSSFLNDSIPKTWGHLPEAGALPNGAHFIIEKNGTIICLTPPVSRDESRISYDRDDHKWILRRHQDGNPVAIGIENLVDSGKPEGLTIEQIESNAKLARWLIWMEKGTVDYAMSHHQFNDDKNYDLFLTAFKLKHLQKQYRTKGRKDIGDRNLKRIIYRIDQSGYEIHSFFELP